MVSNGNHPLNDDFQCIDGTLDELALEEFVLGQMLPQQEEEVRRHLEHCGACRAKVVELRHIYQDISTNLRQELDQAKPGPGLSFDHIASDWRKPPRRVTLLYRLQQLVPTPSSVFLMTLLVLAFLLLIPSTNSAALRSLELARDYDGPPAVVAAATDEGLVVVRLLTGNVDVVNHFSYLTNPRDLQISPDGEWLAVQQDRTLHIIQTNSIGAHVRISLRETANWAWAPDSQSLAYTDGTGQLVVFDIQTQTNRVIVPAVEHAWGTPVWTPDSRQIVYAVIFPLPSGAGQRSRQGIWRVTLETGYRVEMARNTSPDETFLVPTAWIDDSTRLLAWDVSAAAAGTTPVLYQVDAAAHTVVRLSGQTQAQGLRPAWPVSDEGITLAANRYRLYVLDLVTNRRDPILDPIPQPTTYDWAPNNAWIAYTVSGAAEGQGLYLFAVTDKTLRQIELPDDATEKDVTWADPEHLFVTRQRQGEQSAELWLVSLTTGEAPQRILTNVRLPANGPYLGWHWQDVLTAQPIANAPQ